jgi:hypothetical protein
MGRGPHWFIKPYLGILMALNTLKNHLNSSYRANVHNVYFAA